MRRWRRSVGVYLARVEVRNFRNLRAFKIDLAPGLNVLVGENNVGKTNLFDAIRIALGPASVGGFPLRLTPEDRHRLASGEYVDEPIEVDLTFESLTPDEQAEFLDCLNYDANDPATSTASIHYRWSWSEKTRRWDARRSGSTKTNTYTAIPEDNLQSIRVILLGALRDAVSALAPGRQSRLGRLLQAVADDEDRERLGAVMKHANDQLEGDEDLIQKVEKRIDLALSSASKGLSQSAAIRSSEQDFDRIVNGLRLLVKITGDGDTHVAELRSNGLGYNNLLYIGTVLSELAAAKDATLPMLLVEEPEAHLHPQLQTLLVDFLASGAAIEGKPPNVQTIVTTHSPSVASHVAPRRLAVIHRTGDGEPTATRLDACGLDDVEMRCLQRMFDVTRATLLFSRGVLLVEGVTEQLLVPVFAERLGRRLEDQGVSVISLAGVSFATIAKLFGNGKLGFPVAIVTDADPEIEYPGYDPKDDDATPKWKFAEPKSANGKPVPGARLKKLKAQFSGDEIVMVTHSDVTLEYDLAATSDDNAGTIFDAWHGLYARGPTSLKRKELEEGTDAKERARLLWQAICVAKPTHGKGELAQALADALAEKDADGKYVIADFVIPKYLVDAIEHVLPPELDIDDGSDAGPA